VRPLALRSTLLEGARRTVGDERFHDIQALTTELVLRSGRRGGADQTAVRALVGATGPIVGAGPFAGLRYGPLALRFGQRIAAKLLASYESELYEAIERIAGPACPVVVNVGAADGYYAVGLARRTGSRVIAYEADPFSRRLCRETARVNGVTRQVEVRNACTASELAELDLPSSSLLVIDCEGCEAELVNLERVPALRDVAAVVELHDFVQPGISEDLISRLRESHDVQVIDARPRYPLDWPALMTLPGLDDAQRELAINELRPAQMRWAVCTPKAP